MGDEHHDSDVIMTFMAITGASEEEAVTMLTASDFKLDEAVNLFYAHEAAAGPGNAAGRAGGGGNASIDGIPPELLEDEVRAPLPTKVDRLYGDHLDPRMAGMGVMHGRGMAGLPMPHARPNVPTVDAFRDFKAEGDAAAGGAKASGSAGLSELFKPPADLIFPGDFVVAQGKAVDEGKWLILNLQSNSEFSSHRLNRDTWTHEALKEMVKGTFVFYQVADSQPEGTRLISSYHVNTLPAILILDPITGAKVFERDGFVNAESLIEDLVPFLDHGPKDPGAGQLAVNISRMKRKHSATKAASRAPMTEEEELQMAIAMSMEGGGAGGAGPSGMDTDDEDLDMEEEEIYRRIQEAEAAAKAPPKPSPEQVQAEAESRLPAEPEESAPSACRVALRMPDGSRIMRRFSKQDTVQTLHDLVLAKLAEAAAGRAFSIAPAIPGAAPLADKAQSLEAAGVAGAMLAVKWD